MRGLPRDEKGLGLLELVVVVTLLSVTLAAAYALLSAVGTMSNRMSARANATDESQYFVDTVEGELLQAASLKSLAGTATVNADAQAAFYAVEPRGIGFYADIDHDGRPERIAYFMQGASLMRQQTTASNASYPYSWEPSSTPSLMVQSIDPEWDGAVFSYFGNGTWPPTPIASSSDVASITVVTVEMRNMATWADQTVSYAASSTVRVRTVGNGF